MSDTEKSEKPDKGSKSQKAERGEDAKGPPAAEKPAGTMVRVKNNHHLKSGYTVGVGPANPGGKVVFSDIAGHEQDVTEAQAEYLLEMKYTYVIDQNNGRTVERARFVRA